MSSCRAIDTPTFRLSCPSAKFFLYAHKNTVALEIYDVKRPIIAHQQLHCPLHGPFVLSRTGTAHYSSIPNFCNIFTQLQRLVLLNFQRTNEVVCPALCSALNVAQVKQLVFLIVLRSRKHVDRLLHLQGKVFCILILRQPLASFWEKTNGFVQIGVNCHF